MEHAAGNHSLDLTVSGGMGTAIRYLKWLGDNMPGYEYKRKKDVMVIFLSIAHKRMIHLQEA